MSMKYEGGDEKEREGLEEEKEEMRRKKKKCVCLARTSG